MLTITTPGGQPLAHIHKRTMKTTEDQVAEFLLPKVRELRAKADGFVSITLEGKWHCSDDNPVMAVRAYNEHVGHSEFHPTVDGAIAQIASRVGGRTQSKMLREKANELIRQAVTLEEEGK